MTTSSHVVAVTRWSAPAEPLVAPLAALLRRDPYELRGRLAAPLPAIVATLADDELARETEQLLRGAGHGVVACDAARLARVAPPVRLQRVELPGGTLLGVAERASIELPLSQVEVVLEAMHVRSEGTSAQPLGYGVPGRRGVGLMAIAQTGRRSERVDLERVLYLARRPGDAMLVVGEASTQLVGALHRATRRESLLELLRLVRERAPRAVHDARLLTQKRPAVNVAHTQGMAAHPVPGRFFATQTDRASNVSGTDLAAHLLALAHRSGQA